jgi:HEAT repeat protein
MPTHTRSPITGHAAVALLLCLGLAVGACSSGPSRTARSTRSTTRPKTTTSAQSRPEAAQPTRKVAEPRATIADIREQATVQLVTLARNGSPEERANAIEGLRFAEGRLAGIAPDALHDPSPGVRAVTCSALAKSKVCSCADLVRPLLNDGSKMVRASAILSQWKCGRQPDPSFLAEMLQSPQPTERAHAAWVLGEMGESSARVMLAEAARDTVKRAAPTAQKILDLQIAEARVKLGDDAALTDIRTALQPTRTEDLESTALAAQIVGDLRDRPSTNALIELIEFKDDQGRAMPGEVRLSAAAALAKLGQPKGAYLAQEFLANDSTPLRAQAALLYGALGLSEHLPTLSALLNDPAPQVRIAAATAILQLSQQSPGRSSTGN